MRYRSGDSFRQALSDQLRNDVRASGLDFQWLWRLIAFERLLARLVEAAPDLWVLKGGLALELRLAHRARPTQDVDLAWMANEISAHAVFRDVRLHDLGDYFEFMVERTSLLDDADVEGTVRYRASCELAGRKYSAFHLDVAFGVSILSRPDALPGPEGLTFSGLSRIEVPCIRLDQHLAEKVHAYVRAYGPQGVRSTRVKDLVDMVLIQANARLVAGDVRSALAAVFAMRGSTPPLALPPPPEAWRVPYRRMASALAISPDLDEGYRLAAALLTPILDGSVDDACVWDTGLGWVTART